MHFEPVSASRVYAPGDVIGDKYRLVSPLGEGGMGSVWLAENTVLEVDVAIKLIRRDANAPAADQRLLREARAAARLGHPCIVRVFDFGVTDAGDPFIVMELLHGEPLSKRIDREGRLSAIEAVRLLLPAADALATAHSKGIVHRDLKSENIFVSQDESGRIEPKVVDFGIAKIVERLPSPRLTQAGTVLGSPEYMSPEQAAGEDQLDARSDIWSFCVVLYEAICGRLPFEGANYNAVLRAILDTEPRSIVDFAAGDQELWQILRLGLTKEREQRWRSIRELGAALATWLFEHGVAIDIRNASLRASWIDIERNPQYVAGSTEQTNVRHVSGMQRMTAAPVSIISELPLSGPSTLEPGILARTRSDAAPATRSRRRLAIAAAAGTLVSVSVVAGLWSSVSNRSETDGVTTGATPMPAVAASASPPAPAFEPIAEEPPAAVASVAPSASSEPARVRPQRASGTSERNSERNKQRKAGTSAGPPKPSSAPSARQAGPHDQDFGF